MKGENGMSELFGIDVSHYQGNIDWGKVKATGKVEFAIMKAMYETSKRADETFEKNYISCGTNGISRGVYNFIGSVSASDPVADANAFLKILNGRKLEMGIWLDVESKNLRNLGKEKIESVILKETEIFESAGYKVGIYCNYDWYKNVITDKIKKVFDGRFWIARYPKADNGQYNTKSTLSPKSYAVAWQYSSNGKVDGIVGNVDMDVLYKPIEEVFGKTEATPTNGCPYEHPTVCVTSRANAILKRFKGKYVTKGTEVGYVQWHLDRLGYDLGKGGIDLKCGGDTTKAIGKFQKDHGLKQDKIAGSKTYSVMDGQ